MDLEFWIIGSFGQTDRQRERERDKEKKISRISHSRMISKMSIEAARSADREKEITSGHAVPFYKMLNMDY